MIKRYNKFNITSELIVVLFLLFPIAESKAQLLLQFDQSEQIGVNAKFLEKTINQAANGTDKILINEKNQIPDLLSLDPLTAESKCNNGELTKLNNERFKEFFSFRVKNYLYKQKNKCSITYAVYSLVIAYPVVGMVTTRPDSPKDLFDLENFPGIRVLPNSGQGNLEWALLAYGIPRNEVYNLLSTQRGYDLAFKQLDKIRRYIKWYDNTTQLRDLIKNNALAFVVGPNTLFYEIQFSNPLEIIWNSQLLIEMKMAINSKSKQIPESMNFISHLLSDSLQFNMTYNFTFGPVYKKTLKTLSLLPDVSQIVSFVPTYHSNLKQSIWLDHNWHRITKDDVSQRLNLLQ